MSFCVESRLAMKEVPTMGRPRGPGGRWGVALVADISRELLGHEGGPYHDTPCVHIDFLDVNCGSRRNGRANQTSLVLRGAFRGYPTPDILSRECGFD